MSAVSALEDARDLLKLTLELVEDDNGYCEMTRLMESTARAYIKACETQEKINGVLNIDWDHPHRYGVRIDLEGDDVAVLRAALSCSAPPEATGEDNVTGVTKSR